MADIGTVAFPRQNNVGATAAILLMFSTTLIQKQRTSSPLAVTLSWHWEIRTWEIRTWEKCQGDVRGNFTGRFLGEG